MPLSHSHSPPKGTSKLAVVHDSIIAGASATIVIDTIEGFVCLDRERDPERDVDDYHRSVSTA
jgi:hypothetical protein